VTDRQLVFDLAAAHRLVRDRRPRRDEVLAELRRSGADTGMGG
jgi:hypothetical protein